MEKFKKDIGELSKDGENISLGDLEFALYQLVQLVLKEFRESLHKRWVICYN